MIPQAEGKALIETLEDNGPEQGALVPMNCKKDSRIGDKNQQCHAAVKADRELIDGLVMVRLEGMGCGNAKQAVGFRETSERTRSQVRHLLPALTIEGLHVNGTTRRSRLNQQLIDGLTVAKRKHGAS